MCNRVVKRGKAHSHLNRKIYVLAALNNFYHFVEGLCRQNYLGGNYLRKHRHRSKLHKLADFVLDIIIKT